MGLRLHRSVGVSAVVLSFAVSVAGPALAAAPTIWVKAGASVQEAQATYDACYQDTQAITNSGSTTPYPRSGPVVVQVPAGASAGTRASYAAAGAGGAIIGSLIVYGIEENIAVSKLRAKALPRCMHQKGYHQMALTAQEDSAQHSQDTEKRVAWLADLYSRPEFAQRVADASRLPTPLPAAAEGRPPSTVLGSLMFDPPALSAVAGVVKDNGAVLTGPLGHWRTATLKTDVNLPGVKDGVLHAGAPFQLAALGDAASPYWCTAEHDTHVCLRMQGDYYVSIMAKGPFWSVAGMAPNAAESGDIDDADIALNEGGADAVGSVDFSLEVRNLTDKSVRLVAIARRDGEEHELWRNDLDFDAKGEAKLGLWNYRLVLTRAKGGVTARYTLKPPVN